MNGPIGGATGMIQRSRQKMTMTMRLAVLSLAPLGTTLAASRHRRSSQFFKQNPFNQGRSHASLNDQPPITRMQCAA
jgi:hypothetical protein